MILAVREGNFPIPISSLYSSGFSDHRFFCVYHAGVSVAIRFVGILAHSESWLLATERQERDAQSDQVPNVHRLPSSIFQESTGFVDLRNKIGKTRPRIGLN